MSRFICPVVKPSADSRLKRAFSKIGVPEACEFVPDPFQIKAVEAVRESDCLVTAPTGSGKTWIAVKALEHILEQGGRAWYASPLKALSNSKLIEFGRIFGPDRVGILTGDRKENTDAPIIVGTTEILRNQLYDSMHQGKNLAFDLVVMDEAHYLSDPDRGVVWEETLIYLPQRVRLLLLSATIGNAADYAGWISGIRQEPCVVVAETQRPVPLIPLFLHPSGELLPLSSMKGLKVLGGLDRKVSAFNQDYKRRRFQFSRGLPPVRDVLKVLSEFDLLPAIFFMKSRKDCDAALTQCPESLLYDPERQRRIKECLAGVFERNPHLAGHKQVSFLTSCAAAAHHSGHLPAWKLVVEGLMEEGLLDAVFATSTVAAGVNFPARTVVIFNSDRFNGMEFMPLTPTEFHQMTGRAGRRGLDSIGFALMVPGAHMDLERVGALVAAGAGPVISRLKIDFSMVLNLLLSHTPEDVHIVLDQSFARFLMDREKKAKDKRLGWYRDAANPNFLWREFLRHLEFLKELSYVGPDDRLTEDGIWASRLRVDLPLFIGECFRKNLLPKNDPRILAAMVAVFVQEKEMEEGPGAGDAPKKLVVAYNRLVEGLTPLTDLMMSRGFSVRSLSPWPAAAVYDWASGKSWEETAKNARIAEGDLAMLITRVAENLRQMTSLDFVFPQEAKAAHVAIDLLMHGPLDTSDVIIDVTS
ncbi:MAG: DEAD/DEAH box helicase [Deltaproteobacteria bacterium]|nr:DEAD/DEAH box helicase [Deltaproteobacteria bacterium]